MVIKKLKIEKKKKVPKESKKGKVKGRVAIKDIEDKKKQIRFLKTVIEDLINKQSVEIIDLLAGKKDVNEFIIAKNLDLTINQTRNILYKLSDFGLVSFNRKKDKRKGWYIYFWTLNSFQTLGLLEGNLKKKLDILENNLKNRKDGRHYVCNTCSIEVSEETALLNEFACSECDEVYELSDDSEVINDLEKKITKIKKEMESVVGEREKEGEKLEKEKSKKIKIEEKKRSEARAKTRKLNKIKRDNLKKEEAKVKIKGKKIVKEKDKKVKKKVKKKKGILKRILKK